MLEGYARPFTETTPKQGIRGAGSHMTARKRRLTPLATPVVSGPPVFGTASVTPVTAAPSGSVVVAGAVGVGGAAEVVGAAQFPSEHAPSGGAAWCVAHELAIVRT